MAMFEMMSRSSVGDGGTDVHWVAGDLVSKLCDPPPHRHHHHGTDVHWVEGDLLSKLYVILCVGPQAQAGLGNTELQKWVKNSRTNL